MTPLATLVLALSLAAEPASLRPADKAARYYSEGMRLYQKERFAQAAEDFRMAASMARFAFQPEKFLGDALRMSSDAAVHAGDGTAAVKAAKAFVEWADARGVEVDRARAWNDLAEAYLLLDLGEDADRALKRSGKAAEAAGDAEQRDRHDRLVARRREPAPAATPGGPTSAAPKP